MHQARPPVDLITGQHGGRVDAERSRSEFCCPTDHALYRFVAGCTFGLVGFERKHDPASAACLAG